MNSRKYSSDGKPPTQPPQRPDEHRTDTAAVRIVEARMPINWPQRDTHDRDYGIDLLYEIFEGEHPTGGLILLQVKGHEAEFSRTVSMAIPVKTLLYARMFAAPFFLLTVSLADQTAYYVWLQKYIKTRLEIDSPNWRTQDSAVVKFPIENELDEEGIKRIAILSRQYAQRDVGLEFMWNSSWLMRHVKAFFDGQVDEIDLAVQHATQMARLASFWEFYGSFTEEFDLDRLLNLLKKIQMYKNDEPEDEDIDELDIQLDELSTVQTLFLSNDDLDRFTVENSADFPPY